MEHVSLVHKVSLCCKTSCPCGAHARKHIFDETCALYVRLKQHSFQSQNDDVLLTIWPCDNKVPFGSTKHLKIVNKATVARLPLLGHSHYLLVGGTSCWFLCDTTGLSASNRSQGENSFHFWQGSMACTYDEVISVISRPPDKRTEFGVNNVLPWFRKKSDLFKKLKTGKFSQNMILTPHKYVRCRCHKELPQTKIAWLQWETSKPLEDFWSYCNFFALMEIWKRLLATRLVEFLCMRPSYVVQTCMQNKNTMKRQFLCSFPDCLCDLIHHLQFVTLDKDTVMIRQGEIGDWWANRESVKFGEKDRGDDVSNDPKQCAVDLSSVGSFVDKAQHSRVQPSPHPVPCRFGRHKLFCRNRFKYPVFSDRCVSVIFISRLRWHYFTRVSGTCPMSCCQLWPSKILLQSVVEV